MIGFQVLCGLSTMVLRRGVEDPSETCLPEAESLDTWGDPKAETPATSSECRMDFSLVWNGCSPRLLGGTSLFHEDRSIRPNG